MKKIYVLALTVAFSIAMVSAKNFSAADLSGAQMKAVTPVQVNKPVNNTLTAKELSRLTPVLGVKGEAPVASKYTTLADDEWVSLGNAKYTDDFVTTFFGVGNQTFEVEVQENANTPGYYRLVAPYSIYKTLVGGSYSNRSGLSTIDTNLYIHAEDPEKVTLVTCNTGYTVNSTYGSFTLYSYAYLFQQQGETDDDIAAEGYFGTLEEGIITFPVKSLLVSMSKFNNNELYYANIDGAFRVVLPGGKDYTVTASNDGCAYDGDWSFTVGAGADIATTKISWLQGEWEVDNELYQLIDAYGESLSIPVAPGSYTLPLGPLDPEQEGRYTFIVLGYDEEDNLRCGDYTYFYAFTDHEDEWETRGMVKYGEDFIGSFYKVGPTEYSVELQENIENPGYYRLVNAYQDEFSLAASNYLECEHNHYIYINATDPENVVLEESVIGFDLGYGFMSVSSLAAVREDEAEEEDFGKLVEKDEDWKVITFGEKKLLFAESEEGKGAWYFANSSSGFYVEIPKYSLEEYFEWTFELPAAPELGELYLLDAESPIDTEVTYSIENEQELTTVNLLAEGDHQPIAEIVDTEDGKALKINRIGMFDLVTTIAGNEDFKPLTYVQSFRVDALTGISKVEASKAPARYYNLQGVEIAEPTDGIYIRITAGHPAKIIK